MSSSDLAISPPTSAQSDLAFRRRIIAGVIAICAAAILGVAAWLEPSPSGMGTHHQLHMPACGWVVMFDMPCPSCGMTTAFAHAAEGRLLQSFLAQPLGFMLAMATSMALLLSVHVAATGSRLGSALTRLWRPRAGWAIGGLVLAAWGYKILSHKGVL
jgi:hypothetical protein